MHRNDLDCADVCATTAGVLSRHTGYDAALTLAQVQAALQAVRTCGDSCQEHAGMHEHCRLCAEVCRETEGTLTALVGQLQPSELAPERLGAAAPQA